MKGIFIITLALCLGACAAQPENTVTADQLASESTDQTQPSNEANVKDPDRVYLDDYERVPFPAQGRSVRVIGRNKG